MYNTNKTLYEITIKDENYCMPIIYRITEKIKLEPDDKIIQMIVRDFDLLFENQPHIGETPVTVSCKIMANSKWKKIIFEAIK